MFDRMSMLLGASAVTAGVSAALLAGVGVANAVTETGAGGDTSTSDSAPANSPTARDEAGTDREAAAQDANQSAGSGADADEDPEDAVDDPEDAEGAEGVENPEGGEDPEALEDVLGAEPGSEDPDTAFPEPRGTTSLGTTDQPVAEVAVEPELSAEPDVAVEQETAPVAVDRIVAPEPTRLEPTPVIERLSMVSAADAPAAVAAAPSQTLLSILGAVVFNVYSNAIRVVGGPPLLPQGSTVTVQSSTLEIDCGDGYEVPADWYVPAGPTPTQLIYLQHGFMAAGPFYSYTAARVAEATHSVVVATSLTSNFLACDGCWVGGSPMHKAVADLFIDGNTALADSAATAGYGPSLVDGLQRIALSGHSAGGGLAAGAAGYMVGNGTIDRLAGVVMLDGVGFGSVMPDALAKLPDELPVYNLAGKAYFWNMNGSAGAALEQEWPGKFSGVRLIGGLHSDTMLGGNPLIQAGLYLVTGWSKIENVKAAEVLSAAWINDMFAGSPMSPYYGAAGTMLEIETSAGTAEAYVMPGPPEWLGLIDMASQFVADIVFSLDFATCAAHSAAPAGLPGSRQPNNVMELVTPNTALSLDGGTKPGQSIGQQCMHG